MSKRSNTSVPIVATASKTRMRLNVTKTHCICDATHGLALHFQDIRLLSTPRQPVRMKQTRVGIVARIFLVLESPRHHQVLKWL